MKLALALLVVPALAVAEPAVPAQARALAERGRIAHDRGDYPAAIAAFTEAYALAPSPALLFDLAQAYRLAGRCADAAVMYRRYLANDPDPEARALAETQLEAVEHCRAAPRTDPGQTKKEVAVTWSEASWACSA
jgi:tetratricopeptide (TPR) repeat protein